MAKRGISLMDLLLPAGAQTLIPAPLAEQLSRLVVVDYRSTTTSDAYVHRGAVQSIAESGLSALLGWPIEAPGLNRGLKFQLTFKRDRTAPVDPSGALEPGARGFQLDLLLDRVAIKLASSAGRPLVRAARLVVDDGANPAHLVPNETQQFVWIVGSGALRIGEDSTGNVSARVVDWPDPLAPESPTGLVIRLAFDPPHFFIGDSRFGMTVDRLAYDLGSAHASRYRGDWSPCAMDGPFHSAGDLLLPAGHGQFVIWGA